MSTVHRYGRLTGAHACLRLLFLVALLLGTAGVVGAASPPMPPTRFYGVVQLHDQPAPAGAQVIAWVGRVACGSAVVRSPEADVRYVLDVPAPQSPDVCHADGAALTFTVDMVPAIQAGSIQLGRFIPLDLSDSAPPVVVSEPAGDPSDQ